MEKIHLESNHFANMEKPTDGHFFSRYVDQIQKVRTSLFDEMVSEISLNVETYQMIQKRYMMARKMSRKRNLVSGLKQSV